MIWCCQFVIGFPRCCVAPGNAPDAKNRLRMTIVTMLRRKVTIVTKSRTKWLPRVENVRGTGRTKITMTRTMFTGLPTPANLWEGSFLLDHKFHWIIKRTEWRVNKDIGTFQIGARQIIISSSNKQWSKGRSKKILRQKRIRMGGPQSLASLSQQQIYTELNTHKYATNYTEAFKNIFSFYKTSKRFTAWQLQS